MLSAVFAGHRRPRHGRGRPWGRVAAAAFSVITAAGLTAVAVPAAAPAASQTVVSLAFDNGTISQYTLGYQQALQPHGANATFFVNSGTVGASGNFMSWAQLGTLAGAGDDIGGKTVNATNLTTDPNPAAQVCNDRAALLQHGLTPVAFAYPGGTQNATVQGIVKSCGYGNARTAGGLSPTGATYAETLPPANWLATRAYAPSAVTLANMESLVSGAASHGGGWDQIVIGKVCSQALDPANYSACSTSSGHIELADLNSFLDWMASAGQAGGAPAGATVATVRSAVTSADTSAPVTTITCNGTACSNSPYSGVVSVALAATDTGSGVASTHYTTDGSDPTQSSPTYTGPFNVNGASTSTTVKFRSWDYAGNAEAAGTQVIQAPPDTTPPATTIACNGAPCSATSYVANVAVTLSATDSGGSGVDKTYYTTDGSTPTTSSTVYAGAFTLNAPGSYNVMFFSTDKAGNAEAVKSQLIQIDKTAPATTITCNSAACSTGWYKTTPVTVTLSATDTGGSGLDRTVYTTDGSNPTTSATAKLYSGPFTVAQTTTVKFFSRDIAGNAEAVKSQLIQIDGAAPTVSITQPANGSSFAQGAKVTISANAADLGTGSGAPSGIASVTFYLDGTTVIATDNASPYTTSWNTNKIARGTHQLTAVATDAAGNTTTSASITVTIT